MTKVSFFETEEWEKEYLQKSLGDLSLSFSEGKVVPDEETEVLGVFVYSEVNKEILDKMPSLKFITTMSTGYDHIDVELCRERGIGVANVPHYGSNTVAEHTFALILTLSRRIRESLAKVEDFDFSLDGLRGFDLKGKTIGVVGTGGIGEHVVRIAQGFGMNVIGCDIQESLDIEYCELDELLGRSDIITLHVPLLKSTKYLINEDNIGQIKKGAYLINTARGGLVETKALARALDEGILAGVGLDVLEEEDVIKEEKVLLSQEFEREDDLETVLRGHMLVEDPRVIVTPHNAFNSKEALQRILQTTVKNIRGYLSGKEINIVNEDS